QNNAIVFKEYTSDENISDAIKLPEDQASKLREVLAENNFNKENPAHARIMFEKDEDARAAEENMGDGKDYYATFVIEELQNEQEKKTFLGLVIFTAAFGILILLLSKKLT